MWQFFRGSIIVTLLGLVAGYALGGWQGVWLVAVLSVLETSLSFDNAIVNATVLRSWDEHWRRLFIVWGLPVAVFGMRIIFPLVIVAAVTGLGMGDVVNMALFDKPAYAAAITSAHHQVAAFGGAFLMMVFWKFFVDANKDEHWLRWLEAPLTRLGKIEAVEMILTLLMLVGASSWLHGEHRLEFIVAGIWGLATFVAAKGLGTLLGGEEDSEAEAHVIRQGVGGFVYLELLDASFSFDGVIGAFALTNDLLTIAVGLGVGAMFVRSLTLLLVARGTLDTYRYLEHGAFWAIGALAAIMLLGVAIEIPESVTGLLGAVLIGLSLWSSIRANRREAAE